MNRYKSLLLLGAVLLLVGLPLWAAERAASTGGVSPHETFSKAYLGRSGRVIIVYGRPYTKDPRTGQARKIWGGLVPYDKVWRTGADEATMLITQNALKMGDLDIPPGAYTLFTLPAADGSAKLIINKQLGQWGLEYHQDRDLGRVDLKKDDLPTSVDQFTMALDGSQGNGVLSLKWENIQYSVPFTVTK
jgi:hypothetical protein